MTASRTAVPLLLILIVSWLGVGAKADMNLTEVPVLPAGEAKFLTQPYLQNPDSDSVRVVWLTNFEGRRHWVVVAKNFKAAHARGDAGPNNGLDHGFERGFEKYKGNRYFSARSRRLERLFEDGASKIEMDLTQVWQRQVWRHEAEVFGLAPDTAASYWVLSADDAGRLHRAGPYRLQPAPSKGRSLQILLSSDQQERFNTLANYQKVAEHFPGLDAIFFAGDLANHPRRGSEWFDNYRSAWHTNPTSANPSFFPAMQGTFGQQVPQSPYYGGELMQNVPLFPSVANHEVSGRVRLNQTYQLNGSAVTGTINSMFGDPQPRWFAEWRYDAVADQVNPSGNPWLKRQWIADHSHDFEVYRDLFSLPDDGPEGEAYYSKAFGDVFLISMNVSRIWRNWNIGDNDRSKFTEMLAEANNPDEWGFGEHIFTPFAEGSMQYDWLKKTLRSKAARKAKYRVVMFHQSAHGLGDNAVPVLTDPVMTLTYRDQAGVARDKRVLMPQDPKSRKSVFATQVAPLLGRIENVRYEYPIEADYFHRDIEPLMHRYKVQLVLTGHSHIWNRSKTGDVNFMETSNVGNCFGSYWMQPDGTPWAGAQRIGGGFAAELELGPELSRWNPKNYPRLGDTQGREPIMPTLANPMVRFAGEPSPVPFVCSNNITTFTILDTGMGAVRSFAFDVSDPQSEVLEFDRFDL